MLSDVIGYLGGSSASANLLSGSGAPSNGLGKDGDFYIDKANPSLYGPKANGMWPSPTPLGGITVVSRMSSTGAIPVTHTGAQSITLPTSNPDYVELYYNGQLEPDTSFTVNGNIVTVSAGLGAQPGDTLECAFETTSYSNTNPYNIPVDEIPTGSIDGVNTVFKLSYTPIANTLNIYINGLRSDGDDYTLNGTTITFNLPPTKKVRATYSR